jgi:hypothetical protein
MLNAVMTIVLRETLTAKGILIIFSYKLQPSHHLLPDQS